MAGPLNFYWRGFNIACRLLGLGFVLSGLGLMSWGLWLLAHPMVPVGVNGVPTVESGPKLVVAAAGGIVAGLGILMLRSQPFRPDLGDSAFGRRPESARRRYWTGDVVQVSKQADA